MNAPNEECTCLVNGDDTIFTCDACSERATRAERAPTNKDKVFAYLDSLRIWVLNDAPYLAMRVRQKFGFGPRWTLYTVREWMEDKSHGRSF